MKRLAPYFSKKNLNFGLDENPNPTRLTSQTSSDKIFGTRTPRGDTTEEQPSKSNPKNEKRLAPYFSKQNLNFGLDENPNLLDSSPNLLRQNMHKDTRETRPKSNRQIKPKKIMKRLTLLFLKTLNFGLDENPNLLDSRQTSSDKIFGTRTPGRHDRRATVKIKPKK
jgi:hypothetical protein